MKRWICIIISCCMLITAGLKIFAQEKEGYNRIEIDVNQLIELDFENYRVEVIGAGNLANVQIFRVCGPEIEYGGEKLINDYSKMFTYQKTGNKIKLMGLMKLKPLVVFQVKTWLPLVQFNKYRNSLYPIGGGIKMGTTSEWDFLIYVPKEVPVKLIAGEFHATNCEVNGKKY